MDKNSDTPVLAQLSPCTIVAPAGPAEKFEESRNDSALASNLEERLENWGSD